MVVATYLVLPDVAVSAAKEEWMNERNETKRVESLRLKAGLNRDDDEVMVSRGSEDPRKGVMDVLQKMDRYQGVERLPSFRGDPGLSQPTLALSETIVSEGTEHDVGSSFISRTVDCNE